MKVQLSKWTQSPGLMELFSVLTAITGPRGTQSHLPWPQQTLSSAGVPQGCSQRLLWQSAAFTKYPCWHGLNVHTGSLDKGTAQQLLQWLYHHDDTGRNKQCRAIFICRWPKGHHVLAWGELKPSKILTAPFLERRKDRWWKESL